MCQTTYPRYVCTASHRFLCTLIFLAESSTTMSALNLLVMCQFIAFIFALNHAVERVHILLLRDLRLEARQKNNMENAYELKLLASICRLVSYVDE